MCWWTYRPVVDEGHAALVSAVANHFGATADFVCSWGSNAGSCLRSSSPMPSAGRHRCQYDVERHILDCVIQ